MEFDDWESVEDLLLGLSKKDGYKPKKEEMGRFSPHRKRWSPLISPAIYNEGARRRNSDVQGWGGWAALDIDEYDGLYPDAVKPFQKIRHVIYSSASSTREQPKFRVVIPFDRKIEKNEIKHVWFALNREFNELADPQTKDLSRMYYVPARYPDAYNFIELHLDAKMVNLDDLLSRHPYVQAKDNSFRASLSESLQNQLAQYRRDKLTNVKINWSSYHDCPFVNQKMLAEYRAISETGWYHKMFQMLCSIAFNAIRMDYPITAEEIARLALEIDLETGGWYQDRPLAMEAERAIEYALQNS